MKTKTFLSLVIAFAIIFFSSTCFASNNMIENATNGIRNVMGSAENVIDNAASGIGQGVGTIGNNISEGMNSAGRTIQNVTNGGLMNDTNNNYTATRTATSVTNTNGSTFLGMNATAWGWLIMAIVGAMIVGFVWYYGKQHEDGYNPNHEDNY